MNKRTEKVVKKLFLEVPDRIWDGFLIAVGFYLFDLLYKLFG